MFQYIESSYGRWALTSRKKESTRGTEEPAVEARSGLSHWEGVTGVSVIYQARAERKKKAT